FPSSNRTGGAPLEKIAKRTLEEPALMVKIWGIVGQTPTWAGARNRARAYNKRTRLQRDYNVTLSRDCLDRSSEGNGVALLAGRAGRIRGARERSASAGPQPQELAWRPSIRRRPAFFRGCRQGPERRA